jgi:hypothetical protein
MFRVFGFISELNDPLSWDSLEAMTSEKISGKIAKTWTHNISCLVKLVKNKSKKYILNVHLYHQDALIEKEAGKVALQHQEADKTRLREELRALFSTSTSAPMQARFNLRLRRLSEIPREFPVLIARLNDGWAKILGNAHGSITDEALGRWVSVLGPAPQHIAATIYIRLQKDTDPKWLQNLKDIHIRGDKAAGLRYCDAARIGKKYGWTYADANWHSFDFDMRAEFLSKSGKEGIVPDVLHDSRYPNLYASILQEPRSSIVTTT